jgi:hypothetical protein
VDTMKFQVECPVGQESSVVHHFATYDEAMAFCHAFQGAIDAQKKAVVREWLPGRGYLSLEKLVQADMDLTESELLRRAMPTDQEGRPWTVEDILAREA